MWRVSEEPFWHLPHAQRFPSPRVGRHGGQLAELLGAVRDVQLRRHGLLARSGRQPEAQAGNDAEVELGGDLTLFDRLGLELTHANRRRSNQILPVPTAASLGFTTQWQNAGTLASNTWEAAVNLPVVTRRNFNWTMRGTWDRTTVRSSRELFEPDFFTNGGTGQGTGSLFLMTAKTDKSDGHQMNQFGNMWGRSFYKGCRTLPRRCRRSAAMARTSR